jgi:hypothetical protein
VQKVQPGSLVRAVESQPADAASTPSSPLTGVPGPTAQRPKPASGALVARAK